MNLTLGQRLAFEKLLEIVGQFQLTPKQRRKVNWAKALMKDERPSKNSPLRLVVVNDPTDPLNVIADRFRAYDHTLESVGEEMGRVV